MVSAEAGDHLESTDVLIVGGGPAGCAAATLLSRWGHAVTLVTKPIDDTAALGESIPPSTRKLFDVLGIRARVDGSAFVQSTGNTVLWGSDVPRLEYFANNAHGWQVTTTRFEQVMREIARESGARIVEQRLDPGGISSSRHRFVLDCTGRAGVLVRARRLRVSDGPHQTVAMVGQWHADSFDTPEPTHTIIESYDGGWAWSVPTSTNRRFVAVMVDPRTSQLARAIASRAIYLAEIDKTHHMRQLLQQATLDDGPRGWDATMYHATRYVDGNVLFVGDAASFIDPLSSAGIKKALASGWLAAIATHTALVRPERASLALAFYADREREVHAAFLRETQRYWQNAAAAHAHPFWTDRGGEPEPEVDDGELAQTFQRLRSDPELRVRVNQDVRVEERPAVGGTEIILEERLVRDDYSAGVRYAFDVDLVALVELAPAYTSVPELLAAYNQRHAPVAMPDLLAALTSAIARRWLRWCDTY